MKGCRAKVKEELHNIEVCTVNNMQLCHNNSPNLLQRILHCRKDFNFFDKNLQNIKGLTRPEEKDYRNYENPYLERYGVNCMDKVKKTTFLKPHVSITDMLDHIVSATREMFRNTTY